MDPHAVSFRVMRLSKSTLQTPSHLLLDLETDFLSDVEAAGASQQRRGSQGGPGVSGAASARTQLTSPLDVCTLSGMLELPSSFGPLYLGEAFQSYVSVINTSQVPVTSVQCKAELESSRGKVSLYNSTSRPLTLQPGGRHDFIVRHDVKEVGAHTLVCWVGYVMPEGDRRVLPQYFKFTSANPLSVRTKSRPVAGAVMLEACIENTSKTPLVLDYVRFDPAPQMSATEVTVGAVLVDGESAQSPLKDFTQNLKVISSQGGALNVLYRLETIPSQLPPGPAEKGSLGKLDIKWRNTMGEVGRLQTQPISAAAAASRDVNIQAASLPAEVKVQLPFTVEARVASRLERKVRDLVVDCSRGETPDVIQLGPRTVSLPELQPMGSAAIKLQYVALRAGVQKLPEVVVHEAGSRTSLDTLALSAKVE